MKQLIVHIAFIIPLIQIYSPSFSQSDSQKEAMTSSMMGQSEESIKQHMIVFKKIQNSIEASLVSKGIPNAAIKAKDSTSFIIKKYNSFNQMYLKEQMAMGDKKSISRKEYIDCLGIVYNISPFIPLLDSLYNSRVQKIQELRKQN